MVSGKVISKEKQEVVDFATVYLKGTTYGCTTNEEGIYHLHAPAGKYTLVVSAIGYKTIEKPVTLVHGERIKMNVMIDPSVTELGEVVVVSNGVSRVKRSAFNAIAVDTKEFQNSTKNLSDALAKAPGMKLRESGGVGSDMQLMLDGFSGKHVKIFIDGVPQEGVGSSFGLNNIPVNFADRIECKNVSLSYRFRHPMKFVESINLVASVSNLFTISGYSWMDPDVNSFGSDPKRRGVDMASYPSARTFNFGVQIGF